MPRRRRGARRGANRPSGMAAVTEGDVLIMAFMVETLLGPRRLAAQIQQPRSLAMAHAGRTSRPVDLCNWLARAVRPTETCV